MTTAITTPVAIELASGLTVRGTRSSTGSGTHTIVMIHDIGTDLDEFGPLAALLIGAGFDVIAVDLPGHGLSDGEHPSPETCRADVVEILDGMDGDGPVGLVSSGRTASVAASIGEASGVRAQLLISPILDDVIAADAPREHSIRMVIHGDGPNLVGTHTQRFFSHLIGEKMLVFNASALDGAAEAVRAPTVQAHVALFFKRYLNQQRPTRPPN